jgi:hypothetical protein
LSSGFAAHAGYIDRTFYADGNAVQGGEYFILNNGSLGKTRSRERTLTVDLHVRIDFWIKSIDSIQMRLKQFDGRKFSISNQLRHFAGG